MIAQQSPCTTLQHRLGRRFSLPAAFFSVFACGIGVGIYHGPVLCFLATVNEATASEPAQKRSAGVTGRSVAVRLATQRQSYFKLDDNGRLELRNNLPFRSEGTVRLTRTIVAQKTAVVVMDPWMDMASEYLNEYYGAITESRIVPLVREALERGHPVIVLTNDPGKVHYNTNVHPKLAALAAEERIRILYHQDLDDEAFAARLRSEGVDSLIYTGFASNMCVIGRQLGMIPMKRHGFRLFFVPQASAAVEFPDTWQNQSIHRACTRIISQWIAEIINYDDFMKATR